VTSWPNPVTSSASTRNPASPSFSYIFTQEARVPDQSTGCRVVVLVEHPTLPPAKRNAAVRADQSSKFLLSLTREFVTGKATIIPQRCIRTCLRVAVCVRFESPGAVTRFSLVRITNSNLSASGQFQQHFHVSIQHYHRAPSLSDCFWLSVTPRHKACHPTRMPA
jgi:hypothetical protein